MLPLVHQQLILAELLRAHPIVIILQHPHLDTLRGTEKVPVPAPGSHIIISPAGQRVDEGPLGFQVEGDGVVEVLFIPVEVVHPPVLVLEVLFLELKLLEWHVVGRDVMESLFGFLDEELSVGSPSAHAGLGRGGVGAAGRVVADSAGTAAYDDGSDGPEDTVCDPVSPLLAD